MIKDYSLLRLLGDKRRNKVYDFFEQLWTKHTFESTIRFNIKFNHWLNPYRFLNIRYEKVDDTATEVQRMKKLGFNTSYWYILTIWFLFVFEIQLAACKTYKEDEQTNTE